MILSFLVSLLRIVAEKVYLFLMLFKILTKERERLSMWVVWLQRPKQVCCAENAESHDRRDDASKETGSLLTTSSSRILA